MKRLIIAFVLIFSFCGMTFAFDGNDNLTANFGLSIFFEQDAPESVQVTEAILLSSLSFGIGYHLNIIPQFLSPGVYWDIHASILSLLLDDKNANSNEKFQFFQTGIRLYNQFRFDLIDIQPFVGFNLMCGTEDFLLLNTFGILAAYDMFGIEYSFHFPFKDDPSYANAIHRIAFVFHAR